MIQHGQYRIETASQLLVLTLTGAWNEYTAKKMCQELYTCAKPLSTQPWALLTDVSNWELGPPEMWPLLEKVHLWANDHNLHYNAVIAVNRMQRLIIKRTHRPFTNVNTSLFTTRTKAENWLTTQGYPCPESTSTQNQTVKGQKSP